MHETRLVQTNPHHNFFLFKIHWQENVWSQTCSVLVNSFSSRQLKRHTNWVGKQVYKPILVLSRISFEHRHFFFYFQLVSSCLSHLRFDFDKRTEPNSEVYCDILTLMIHYVKIEQLSEHDRLLDQKNIKEADSNEPTDKE